MQSAFLLHFFLVLVVHYGMTSPRVIWTSSIFRSFHLNFFWLADPKNFDGNFRESSWGCRLYRYIDILFCITYWYLIHILCLYNLLFPVKISRSYNSINHNVRFIVGDRFVLHYTERNTTKQFWRFFAKRKIQNLMIWQHILISFLNYSF